MLIKTLTSSGEGGGGGDNHHMCWGLGHYSCSAAQSDQSFLHVYTVSGHK